ELGVVLGEQQVFQPLLEQCGRVLHAADERCETTFSRQGIARSNQRPSSVLSVAYGVRPSHCCPQDMRRVGIPVNVQACKAHVGAELMVARPAVHFSSLTEGPHACSEPVIGALTQVLKEHSMVAVAAVE